MASLQTKVSDPKWHVQYRMHVSKPKPFWIVIKNNGLHECDAAQELIKAYNDVVKPNAPYKLWHTSSDIAAGELTTMAFGDSV